MCVSVCMTRKTTCYAGRWHKSLGPSAFVYRQHFKDCLASNHNGDTAVACTSVCLITCLPAGLTGVLLHWRLAALLRALVVLPASGRCRRLCLMSRAMWQKQVRLRKRGMMMDDMLAHTWSSVCVM